MCACVREDGIISLMVLTHLVLSHDLLVGPSHVTVVELRTVSRKGRLSYGACACAGAVTWPLLLLKQGGFVSVVLQQVTLFFRAHYVCRVVVQAECYWFG